MASLEVCLDLLKEYYEKVLMKLDELTDKLEENILYEYSNVYLIKIGKYLYTTKKGTSFLELSNRTTLLELIGKVSLENKLLRCDLSFPLGLLDKGKYSNKDNVKVTIDYSDPFVRFLDKNERAIDISSLRGVFIPIYEKEKTRELI